MTPDQLCTAHDLKQACYKPHARITCHPWHSYHATAVGQGLLHYAFTAIAGQAGAVNVSADQLVKQLRARLAAVTTSLLQDKKLTWSSRETLLRCIMRLPSQHRSWPVQQLGLTLFQALRECLMMSQQAGTANARKARGRARERMQLLLDTVSSLDSKGCPEEERLCLASWLN